MKDTKKREPKPNKKLKYQRELRGWTQQELVDQLLAICEEDYVPAISEDTISRWERGMFNPNPYWRKKLCQLFAVSLEELGVVETPKQENESKSPISFLSTFTSSITTTSPSIGAQTPETSLKSTTTIYPTPSGLHIYIPTSAIVAASPAKTQSPLSYTTASRNHARAIDTLLTDLNRSSEEIAYSWLLTTLSDLSHLLDAGWAVSDILTSLQVTLSGLITVSPSTQHHLLGLAGKALLGEQFSMIVEQTAPDGWELAKALSQSNAAGWAAFNMSPIPSIHTASRAQLQMLQNLHDHLPSQVRPFLYSSVYRLIGASQFFQARYGDALQSYKQSYLAALEAGDAWNMAETLGWQGGVWKACGQQQKAIEDTEKALRLTTESNHPQTRALQARLFAQFAESAALLHLPKVVAEKLTASAELLNQLDANEEFDAAAWHQYQATCALYLGDAETAVAHFQQASYDLKSHWTLQRAYNTQFLMQSYVQLGDAQKALVAAQAAFPAIVATGSILLISSFIDDVRQLQARFSKNREVEVFAQEVYQKLASFVQNTIPRYLEAKLP